jgi:hypothetical protein
MMAPAHEPKHSHAIRLAISMLAGGLVGAIVALTVGSVFHRWFQAAPLVAGVLCGLGVELFRRFIESTIPQRDTGDGCVNEQSKDLERKRRRWPSAVPYVILAPILYMGAYYATFRYGFPDPIYMVGDAQLPDCFQTFFAPADWVEHRLELGPYRPRPVRSYGAPA